jgi:hypothetical protein
MYVYEMGAGQRLVQHVALPTTRGVRGVVASPKATARFTGSPLDRPASRGRHTWAEADQDGPLAKRAGRRRRLWARAQRDLRAYAEGRGNQGEEQRKAPGSQVMPAASGRAAAAIHVS